MKVDLCSSYRNIQHLTWSPLDGTPGAPGPAGQRETALCFEGTPYWTQTGERLRGQGQSAVRCKKMRERERSKVGWGRACVSQAGSRGGEGMAEARRPREQMARKGRPSSLRQGQQRGLLGNFTFYGCCTPLLSPLHQDGMCGAGAAAPTGAKPGR